MPFLIYIYHTHTYTKTHEGVLAQIRANHEEKDNKCNLLHIENKSVSVLEVVRVFNGLL